MAKHLVVFIDDEPIYALAYVRELSKEFEVLYVEDIVSAASIVNSGNSVDAIILDIMIPSPEGVSSETADGLDTGLWFLKNTVGMLKSQSIPLIALTNRNLPHVQDVIDTLVIDYCLCDGLLSLRPKIETPRFLLPILVRAVIHRFRSEI